MFVGDRRTALVVVAAALVVSAPAPLAAAGAPAPPPLSRDTSPAAAASSYGSGSFGRWTVDRFGLPAYRYRVDEQRAAKARQPELAGATSAQHQVGNDNIKGAAFNDGYTQLWSQQRLDQWANLYQPSSRHYGGGYGYLNVDGRAISTLYPDRPSGALTRRDFGVGYYSRRLRAAGVDVRERLYAPFGSDPLLVHDVTIANVDRRWHNVAWFEYWDVNPYDQALGSQRNLAIRSPTWDRAARTLAVAQQPASGLDSDPLSIFAAALRGPVAGHETSVPAFFGEGTRAAPAAVVANRLGGSIAPPSPAATPGSTLFVFRAPLRLAPGRSVSLRYAYGIAHPARIATLVHRYASARDPFAATERAWAAWLPRAGFGRGYRWVARELRWDAYLLRSASVYEEACGHHTVTQGGYYQYADGWNLGFRSWLHYLLPLTYTDPGLAREILLYAVGLQPAGGGLFPYGIGPLCSRVDLGTSNDLDFWLLLAASEYGLVTRDTAFFDRRPHFYASGQSASVWEHLKLAFAHQESLAGPHGGYLMGSTGDWSDFSTQFEQMTESMLVSAQLAYAYPRLAALADLRGDRAFAAQLRRRARQLDRVLRAQWTGGGWYSRGYAGARQVGSGVIFGEPQPWSILAGVPTRAQASTLVANVRRFLTGIGAPGVVHGPARIGSAIVPAAADPGVSERSPTPLDGSASLPGVPPISPGSSLSSAAEWPGGVWFDVNGWLTWALAELDGRVAHARHYAWDEYTRNTLARHAAVFPDHWAGTISVDDTCHTFYTSDPASCGNGLSTNYDGQITEQPTWMVMDAIRLAGITPTESGYMVVPHLPMTRFNLRLAQVGVAAKRGLLRGYIRPLRSGTLRMQVAPPAGAAPDRVVTFADGRRVRHSVRHALVVFDLPARAGRPADWAVAGSAPARTAGAARGGDRVRGAARAHRP